MVIKLSFNFSKDGAKKAPHGWQMKLHSINVDPKGKGAEGGENVLARRYTRCDGESTREGIFENLTRLLY